MCCFAYQVVKDLIAEDDILQAVGAPQEQIEKERHDRQLRQRMWVQKRKMGPNHSSSWRPRKRHRKDAWYWLVCLDNQLRAGTGVGLAHFKQPASLSDRGPPLSWPLLSCATDQGSVEVSAINFCQQELKLNMDDCPDMGHGCWNDVKLALRRSGLMPHTSLMMLTWNVPHGPWAEDRRYGEVVECFNNFFRTTSVPEDSWLFMELLPRMIFDLNDPGLVGNPEAAQLVFDRLRHDNPFANKGAKVNFNRFMSAVKAAEEETARWTFRLFAYMMTCLEQDYLAGSRFVKLLQKSESMPDRSTSAAKNSATEIAVAQGCQNQLVVALMMLTDINNQYKQRAITATCRPVLQWFEEQAHVLRSVHSAFQWLQQQIGGAFLDAMQRILATTKADHLTWIGYTVPHSMFSLQAEGSMGIVEDQDSLAGAHATLAAHLVGARLARCLWMLQGYSCRSIRFLDDDDEVVKREVKAFRSAYNMFREVEAMSIEVSACDDIAQRSQFQLVAVQQLVKAFEANHWDVPSLEIKHFLLSKHSRLLTTQLVEDMFQRQKRRKQTHFTRKLQMASNYKVLLDRQVLDEVHKYNSPAPLQHAHRAGFLPNEIFNADLNGSSVKLGDLTSHRPRTAWYSPAAERHGVRYADVAALAFCKLRGCLNKVGCLWLGCLIDASHCVLVQEVLADGGHGQVYFALSHLPGTCALGWPATRVAIPGHQEASAWTFAECKRLCFLTVVDLAHWRAVSFTWRSPLWQHLEWPNARGNMSSAVLAVVDQGSNFEPIQKVAAKAGFWSFGKHIITSLSKHFGIAVQEGSSLFDMVFKLAQHILACTDLDCMEALRRRADHCAVRHDDCSDVLLELNESAGVFDKEDLEEISQQQKKEASMKLSASEFVEEWKERKTRLMSSSSQPGQTDKKALAKVLKPSAYPAFPQEMISQAEMKKMLPPQASVWTGFSNGSWQCHLPPWRRRSFSWSQYGHHGSAEQCLKHLWSTWLADNGLDIKDCPIRGLFKGGGAASAASSSSSGLGGATASARAAEQLGARKKRS